MSLMPLFADLGDRAPLAVAFLSSTVIDLVAVAALLTMVANAAARRATERRAPRTPLA
jgi:hypothetical protein